MSSVDTRNICPAPSASLAVMIGVFTQKKPSSWKKRWMAMRRRVAHARDGAERVGARAQVGHLAQELQRVLLGLDRVGLRIIDEAEHLHLVGLHLERLALALATSRACRGR